MPNVMTDTTRLAGALADTIDALRRVIRGCKYGGLDVEDAQERLDLASRDLLNDKGWQKQGSDLAIGDYVVPAGATEPVMRIKAFGQKGGAGPIFAECVVVREVSFGGEETLPLELGALRRATAAVLFPETKTPATG